MKMVIEVSEKDYFDFLLQYTNGILDEKTPSHRAKIAIANGIQLPKGHGRLIDADGFIKYECGNCDGFCDNCDCDCLNCKSEYRCDFIKHIDSANVIIEADKEGEEEG